MRIADMNWMQVEAYLRHDDRCVLPFGSTEQHAQLSLCVDAILAEKVAVEAAEPLGIPVYPAMPFGLAPYFAAFPGSISLKVDRRILIVNGHGGNAPVGALALQMMTENPALSIKFHNWYNQPKTWDTAMAIDRSGSHGNWMESFPWTRLANAPSPSGSKPGVDTALMKASPPAKVRDMLGDGSFGGEWRKPDEDMLRLWQAGVAETRAALEGPWPTR